MLLSRASIALRALLLGAALAAAGCGTSIEDVCDDYCDCEGCSDSQYENCVDDLAEIEDLAIDEGCEAEFDDWLDCGASEAECDGDDYELDEDLCDEEFEDLARCAG